MAVYHVSLKRLHAKPSREPAAAFEASAPPPLGDVSPPPNSAAPPVAEEVAPSDEKPSSIADKTAVVAAKPRRQGSKSGRSTRAEKPDVPPAPKALNGSAATASVKMGPAEDRNGSLPVEELLLLPREEAQAILAEVGESTGKVWLALIYRIASLEGQVRELAAELRSRPAKEPTSPQRVESERPADSPSTMGNGPSVVDVGVAPLTARRHRANAGIEDDSKTEMLEKVFRKNWSLRKQDSP